jgi:hypothetical protein
MELDFITTDMFLSFLGCLAIVAIITEAIKHIPGADKINTLWYVLLSSIIVSVLRVIIIGSYTSTDIILGVLNTFAIYLGAIGGYETTKQISQAVRKK